MVQSVRDVDQLVAQRVEQVQPPRDGLAKDVEVECAVVVAGADDRDLQRVGMQVGSFAVQEHGIHAVEPLHRSIETLLAG